MLVLKHNVNNFLNPQDAQSDHDADMPDAQDIADEKEVADEQNMVDWTQGWHDEVYNDNCVNSDITLGEMLLLYYEWMSVHKVRVHLLLVKHKQILYKC